MGSITSPCRDATAATTSRIVRTTRLCAIGEATRLSRSAALGEIAAAVMFPLGPEASFITGAELPVDDGMTGEGLYWRIGKAAGNR